MSKLDTDIKYGLEFFREMSKAGVRGISIDKDMAYRVFWDLVRSDTWAEHFRTIDDLHHATIYNCRIDLAWKEF